MTQSGKKADNMAKKEQKSCQAVRSNDASLLISVVFELFLYKC